MEQKLISIDNLRFLYHNFLWTETLRSMVDKINIMINIFGNDENMEMFNKTESVGKGMHSL